jgi:RimJ/RimL family protein N-acetyltransferase
VIERCGFTPVGRERRALLLGDGSLVDVLGYDMLREERG